MFFNNNSGKFSGGKCKCSEKSFEKSCFVLRMHVSLVQTQKCWTKIYIFTCTIFNLYLKEILIMDMAL